MDKVLNYISENKAESALIGIAAWLLVNVIYNHWFVFHIHTPACPHW